jgi:glycosyltransferase involved in cell wall biosynthesis
MRILIAHNQYLIRGGEEESSAAEQELLRQHGHEVDLYEEHNERVGALSKLRVALKTVWSSESYHILRQRLRRQRYDVVHVQNFFPLISPSIYYAARAEGVPVVQSLRNYRLVCANAALFRDGQVCEDCLGRSVPWPGVVHRCYRDSRVASGTVAAMVGIHRATRTWQRMVAVYIALSRFSRTKLVEGGLPADRIVVKPNFVDGSARPGSGSGGYALFVGRLSPEKGVATLLEAWRQLGGALPLKIVGEGPLEAEVAAACAGDPAIEQLGRRSLAEVYELMGEARFLVLPSEWYEPFGRVAVEAFARGSPVIATALGVMAEMVEDGRTGWLYPPRDAAALAERVRWALAHPDRLAGMRAAALAEFEAKYTPAANYRQLLAIYRRALQAGAALGAAESRRAAPASATTRG